MKATHKILMYIFLLVSFCLFSFLGIKQAEERKWKALQFEIDITPNDLVKILKDAGFVIEESKEYTGDIGTRYGEPISTWGVDIRTNNAKNSLLVFEYPNWEDANHIINYWADWYKETDQNYKGDLFSHGNLVIFIRPADIRLQNRLEAALLDAYRNP